MKPVINGRWVAGVDGCRAGWVVVLGDGYTGQHCACVAPHFEAVVALGQALRVGVIAVDVPIGLLSTAVAGGRACEARARKLLDQRASSVFSAPTRAALAAFCGGGTYQQVAAANRGGNGTAPGLSKQTYHIMSKIAEVDALLTTRPALRDLVYEVHPELCFYEANSRRPMTASKKTPKGQEARRKVLKNLGFKTLLGLLGRRLPPQVRADDLLDACIACWTAKRIATGSAIAVPNPPPVDARGLRMALWR
jgi:predicted RNase H-like nuclease